MEDLDTCLWIVEFNWKREQFHIELLQGRLEKNVAQLLHDGEPANPDWLPIGIAQGAAAANEYREAFLSRWKRRAKNRE